MDFFGPALLLMFLVNKTVDWIRELVPDRLEGKVLIPLSAATGALYLNAFAATEWAREMGIGDLVLSDLNVVAVTLAGLGVGAGGSVLNDIKPNRLSAEQLDRVVETADTVVVETEQPPKPAARRGKPAAK